MGDKGLHVVSKVSDFPEAVEGVIHLPGGSAWLVLGSVAVEGLQIKLGPYVALAGWSSETSSLTSSGLAPGVPFLISDAAGGSILLRDITITAELALELDGSADPLSAVDWFAVNFDNCAEVGTITGYNNTLFDSCSFVGSGSLAFDGTINTIGFFNTIFVPSAAPAIILPATLTVARRFRAALCAFVVLSGATGLQVDLAAFAQPESLLLFFVNFSGPGTYLDGADYTDDEVTIVSTVGITNASPAASLYMTGNATPTVVDAVTPGVFTDVLGTTTPGPYISKFAHASGSLTSTGALSRHYTVEASATITGGANKSIAMRLAVDGVTVPATQQRATTNAGGRVESIALSGHLLLDPGSVVTVQLANETTAGSNVTATDLQLVISALNG